MNKAQIISLFTLLVAVLVTVGVTFAVRSQNQVSIVATPEAIALAESSAEVAPEPSVLGAVEVVAPFSWPMTDAASRVTKKPFGLLIDPKHSPVENDRFSGYHVGVDFETTPEEADIDVPVFAICDGPLVLKQFAKGYGGMAVQSCELNDEPVSIIYGHLDLASIQAIAGDVLVQGQQLGLLGQGHSPETDGVRKHLHLGVYTGSTLDIHGYVKTETETNQWLDAMLYMPI